MAQLQLTKIRRMHEDQSGFGVGQNLECVRQALVPGSFLLFQLSIIKKLQIYWINFPMVSES